MNLKIEDSLNLRWWQKTVVYQIYPRSFKDSTGDGIGDLQGIISKLDYLENLGIETIWFSPFFSSPQEDHGYDIQDYKTIDPIYGTMEDFNNLLQGIHNRSMRIILDLVLNHTSSKHPWFIESASSKNNPKRNWYIWRDGKKPNGKKPPNNWKSMVGGPAWKYYDNTDQWVYFHFLPFQPDLNYRNPEVKKEMFDIIRFWLNKGVDGFRLDIIHTIFEREDLKNNPFDLKLLPSDEDVSSFFQHHLYDAHLQENLDFAIQLRNLIDEYTNPERFLVGEVEGNIDIVKLYYGPDNNGLNMSFLFEFTSTPFDAQKYASLISEIEKNLPYPFTPTYVLGNHDRMRYISRLNNDLVKARILATLQLTLRGVPFIYYGEELGMPHVKFKLRTSQDPIGRKYWWIPISQLNFLGFSLTRDGCRTPMQWNDKFAAGFSPNKEVKTWLKISDSYKESINVSEELQNSNSLLNCYRRLLRIRKENIALRVGKLQLINIKELKNKCLAYHRNHQDQTVFIYLNFSDEKITLKLPKKSRELIFSTIPNRNLLKISTEKSKMKLVPYEGIILRTI